jgi:hypothetical protein
VYRDTIFQASAAEKPQGTASPLRGHLCVLGAIARTRRSRERSNAKTWENGGAGDTAVGSRPQRRWCERGSDTTMEKVASTWQDQGTLTVHRLRKDGYPHPLPPRTNSLQRQLGVLCQAQARKQHSALRSASSAFQKMSGAPTANFAREQIRCN